MVAWTQIRVTSYAWLVSYFTSLNPSYDYVNDICWRVVIMRLLSSDWSRDSSVNAATRQRETNRGIVFWFFFPLFSVSVHKGSRTYPISFTVGNVTSSLGHNEAEILNWPHTPLYSFEFQNKWSSISTPLYVVMACTGATPLLPYLRISNNTIRVTEQVISATKALYLSTELIGLLLEIFSKYQSSSLLPARVWPHHFMHYYWPGTSSLHTC